MGLRFRKSFGLGRLLRLNWSLAGPSLSVGPRGASISLGPRGVHANLGLPGTGLSWRQRLDQPAPRRRRPPPSVYERCHHGQLLDGGCPLCLAESARPNTPRQHPPAMRRPSDPGWWLAWFVISFIAFLAVASTYPILRDGWGGSRRATDLNPEIWR